MCIIYSHIHTSHIHRIVKYAKHKWLAKCTSTQQETNHNVLNTSHSKLVVLPGWSGNVLIFHDYVLLTKLPSRFGFKICKLVAVSERHMAMYTDLV